MIILIDRLNKYKHFGAHWCLAALPRSPRLAVGPSILERRMLPTQVLGGGVPVLPVAAHTPLIVPHVTSDPSEPAGQIATADASA